ALIKEVCHAIAKQFPNHQMLSASLKGDDLLRVIRGYEETWSFPMCAGAVGGTYIPILAPNKNHTEYVN
ncbi:Hypothetical predicted protein, partial [Paramuricea clavata]